MEEGKNELQDSIYEISSGRETTVVQENASEQPISDNELPTDEYGNQIYTSEWLKENTSVSGWLGFFLFALGIGGSLTLIMSVFSIKPEDYANNFFLICTDVVPGLCMFAISVYTIYAFVSRKPNAVFYGRFYVILVLVTNILSLMIGEFDDFGLNTMKRAMQGIVWAIIWFIYLAVSNQVEEVIPKPFRKATKRDWWIVALVFFIPVFCYLIGYTQLSYVVNSREQSEAQLMSTEISEHERSDGRIIFTIPYSFTCSEEYVDAENGVSIKVYQIENENIGNCTLCSDYDDDATLSNFNGYRTNWKDPETNIYSEKAIDSGTKEIKDNTCIYKIVSYDYNGVEVYWRFYMLFNRPTGKVAVMSAYDRNADTSYMDDLIESIHFQ